MKAELLANLAQSLADGSTKVVDLSQTLSEATPVISLPPPFAQTAPFAMTTISRYDEHGPVCYWNNLSLGEHTGTHLDAPVHWYTGKDCRDGSTDTIPVARFLAPACVIDCSSEAHVDEGFLLEPEHVLAWEQKHGRIPPGAWVLMRTDWSKRTDHEAFLNMKADGAYSPGPSVSAVRLLLARDINGWGVECVGTDAGQAGNFDPPFPAHHLLLGNGKLGLASLRNLDLLPPIGAFLIATPLKIRQGSGSPVRAIALVP